MEALIMLAFLFAAVWLDGGLLAAFGVMAILFLGFAAMGATNKWGTK